MSGFPKDAKRGRKLLEGACDAGRAPACTTLASAHLAGRGVAKSKRRAKQAYEKACKLKDRDACDRAADV